MCACAHAPTQAQPSPHTSIATLPSSQKTRFAGKIRELGRALRLKADLQQVVVSADYAAKKYSDAKDASAKKDDSDDEEAAPAAARGGRGRGRGRGVAGRGLGARGGTGGTVAGTAVAAPAAGVVAAAAPAKDTVKDIVLDEKGFWEPLVEVLRICTPIVKLLRLADAGQTSHMPPPMCPTTQCALPPMSPCYHPCALPPMCHPCPLLATTTHFPDHHGSIS